MKNGTAPDRYTEIIKISKRIQKDINKLKLLDCMVDHSHQSISVFDSLIDPEKGTSGEGDDYENTIVFSFNTSRI